jgi:hypothetical protein
MAKFLTTLALNPNAIAWTEVAIVSKKIITSHQPPNSTPSPL